MARLEKRGYDATGAVSGGDGLHSIVRQPTDPLPGSWWGRPCCPCHSKGLRETASFFKPSLRRRWPGPSYPYDAWPALTTQVTQSVDSSLAHLHTKYLDSYVLHGPYQRKGLGDADWEVWAAIEGLYQSGKTKMVGISNVTAEQLTQLCTRAAVKPVMVQNRCYAALGWDKEVREICRAHGIIYQGFSLLTANREVFADPGIRAIAQRLGTGLAQVVFRFAMQAGMLPLTGTTNPQHMKEDLKAEQFTLAEEDMQVIETIGI